MIDVVKAGFGVDYTGPNSIRLGYGVVLRNASLTEAASVTLRFAFLDGKGGVLGVTTGYLAFVRPQEEAAWAATTTADYARTIASVTVQAAGSEWEAFSRTSPFEATNVAFRENILFPKITGFVENWLPLTSAVRIAAFGLDEQGKIVGAATSDRTNAFIPATGNVSLAASSKTAVEVTYMGLRPTTVVMYAR